MNDETMAANRRPFDRVHLQWFAKDDSEPTGAEAEPEEDDDNPDDALNAKLKRALTPFQKQLDELKRESAGKDRRITELTNEKRELQERTLSTDKLLEVRMKEFEDDRSKWEQDRAKEKLELEQLRIENEKTKVISKIPEFPAFLVERVRGTNADEIEADARTLMKQWVRDQEKRVNAKIVTGRPQTGGSKPLGKTADEVLHMTPADQRKWAENASDDEYSAIFAELNET